MDHFVVGDPKVIDDGSQRSAADSGDEDDDDDMQPDTVLKAKREASTGVQTVESEPDLTAALSQSIQDFLQESNNEIRQGLGSNNWVVSGAHTATGKPLLANDTHLELSIPSIWYELHLTAPGWNVKGFTLPGAPMLVLGPNDPIAWGFTNTGARFKVFYVETFNPPPRVEYGVNGAWTKAQIIDETIHIKGQPD